MNDELGNPGNEDLLDPSEIEQLEAIAASLTYEDLELDEPPADLWDRISHSLASEPAPSAPRPVHDAARQPTVGTVTDLTTRNEARDRRPRQTWILGAAAAVLVVAAVAVGVALSDGNNGEVVAFADLEPLAEGYVGEAALASGDEGFTLELLLDSLPTLGESEGYYELWLIKDLETGEMQSLGFVDSSQDVALPPGLNPAEYSTVDLSIEPLDGVPTHSGESVLRGTLTPEV